MMLKKGGTQFSKDLNYLSRRRRQSTAQQQEKPVIRKKMSPGQQIQYQLSVLRNQILKSCSSSPTLRKILVNSPSTAIETVAVPEVPVSDNKETQVLDHSAPRIAPNYRTTPTQQLDEVLSEPTMDLFPVPINDDKNNYNLNDCHSPGITSRILQKPNQLLSLITSQIAEPFNHPCRPNQFDKNHSLTAVVNNFGEYLRAKSANKQSSPSNATPVMSKSSSLFSLKRRLHQLYPSSIEQDCVPMDPTTANSPVQPSRPSKTAKINHIDKNRIHHKYRDVKKECDSPQTKYTLKYQVPAAKSISYLLKRFKSNGNLRQQGVPQSIDRISEKVGFEESLLL